ncbi:hypothetical protein Tco_0923094, partial [Tanacetum coccineum]
SLFLEAISFVLNAALTAGAHERLSAPNFTIEYKDFGDVAYGLRFFVERLTAKSENFDEYVQQIDAIEQVTDLGVVISNTKAIKFIFVFHSKDT